MFRGGRHADKFRHIAADYLSSFSDRVWFGHIAVNFKKNQEKKNVFISSGPPPFRSYRLARIKNSDEVLGYFRCLCRDGHYNISFR
jgi:hypothetical protein